MVAGDVKIPELRQLTNSLFDGLEDQGIDSIHVAQSQYWKVYFTDAFQAETPTCVMGDVYDDLNDVRAEVDKAREDETISWHAFMHLAGLINLVAYAAENGELVKSAAMEARQ
ncbi:MAG: hypothetical protein EOS71_02810 [Mesorhizobium sp.]|nr:hypothetical protein EOA35_35030 [Mesorhizobium sp. M8A.F.Ca.ET.023.01.1.1]RWC78177.1 MAG: hypothetical protein EOS71_02810 [Mesorhizobium sp.]